MVDTGAGDRHGATEDDNDRNFSGDIDSTYTESLRSSLMQSVMENGRGYHRYRVAHTIEIVDY
jgi:hypothetical protein